jgi:hypothetical protein
MSSEPRKAVTPLTMFGKKGNDASDDKVELDEDEKPKPRKKTVMRLMAQGERADKKADAERKVREDGEPLCKLVSMETALRLKQVTAGLNKQLPQDITELRMARLRAPKSSTGAALRDGATVDQAATHAALKALEQWVRILRPFASSQEVGRLIAEIVHVRDDRSDAEREIKPLEVIPPADEPLGAAMRRIVPDPDLLKFKSWEWIEDLLHALSFEGSFDRNSFVHRASTPNLTTMRQTGEAMVSPARPKTTGRILGRTPISESGRFRCSGPITWAGFQNDSGFRLCTSTGSTDKYIKTIPGPNTYCDVDKHLSIPHNVGMGIYPSVGDRRTPCKATPLTQLDRFFDQDFRLE